MKLKSKVRVWDAFLVCCYPSNKRNSKQYCIHRYKLGPLKLPRRSESIIIVKRPFGSNNLGNISNENTKNLKTIKSTNVYDYENKTMLVHRRYGARKQSTSFSERMSLN